VDLAGGIQCLPNVCGNGFQSRDLCYSVRLVLDMAQALLSHMLRINTLRDGEVQILNLQLELLRKLLCGQDQFSWQIIHIYK